MNVDDNSVAIDELVSAVKDAIREADISVSDAGRDLRVATIDLSLKAVATTKAGGGLDFRIPVIGWKVKAGADHSRRRTHTVEISLVPRPDTGPFEVRGGDVEAIGTIRAAIAAAGTGDDPFVLGTGTIELVFAVTDHGTISVGVEGELTDEVTNTLKLGLAPA
jgi:NTP-dependent ternary system trypsin peptidase co-occuring protein